MVRAFVMVTTVAGGSDAAFEAIEPLSVVREAHVVAGTYDLIVEVEGAAVDDVLAGVSTDVAHLDEVEDTRTYVALD